MNSEKKKKAMPNMKDFPLLPGANYGRIMEPPDPDSELPEVEDIDEDDDEMPDKIDPALIEMLGFDPSEIDEDDAEGETVSNADGTMSRRK